MTPVSGRKVIEDATGPVTGAPALNNTQYGQLLVAAIIVLLAGFAARR